MILWEKEISKSFAVPRAKYDYLLLYLLDNALMRISRMKMYEYVQRPRRTILEVLLDFGHTRVPKEYLFDLFPLMRPREFSIASSIKVRAAPASRCKRVSHMRRTETPQIDRAVHRDHQVRNEAQERA